MKIVKKLIKWSFLFFLIKGLIWLAVAFAAVLSVKKARAEEIKFLRDSCFITFESLESNPVSENSSVILNNTKSENNLKQKAGALQNAMPSIFSSSDSRVRLSRSWKDQTLKRFPELSSVEVFNLFYNLEKIHNQLDLELEKDFFRILEQGAVHHITDFNKKQLLAILWIFTKLNMKPPTDIFIQAWRETAYRKRREFTPIDRHGSRGFLRKLQVAPLPESKN